MTVPMIKPILFRRAAYASSATAASGTAELRLVNAEGAGSVGWGFSINASPRSASSAERHLGKKPASGVLSDPNGKSAVALYRNRASAVIAIPQMRSGDES